MDSLQKRYLPSAARLMKEMNHRDEELNIMEVRERA
jgi:hypothetical protein